jgi:hypothetical protein
MLERGWSARANASEVTALRQRREQLERKYGVVVRMHWVRAHIGMHWNELANSLALRAATHAAAATTRPATLSKT